jgi:hypothetical protein
MAISACHFSFSQRHVRGAHELSISLQMALPADLGLRALREERCMLSYLRKLVAIGGFLHQRVAIDAGHPAPRVRTRFPVSLHTSLVATKTHFVLHFSGFSWVFAECNQAADAFAASGSNMVAAGAVTALASSFLSFVARVKEKNFPHLSLGKFLELFSVASLANFVANVGRGGRFRAIACGGPDPWNRVSQ